MEGEEPKLESASGQAGSAEPSPPAEQAAAGPSLEAGHGSDVDDDDAASVGGGHIEDDEELEGEEGGGFEGQAGAVGRGDTYAADLEPAPHTVDPSAAAQPSGDEIGQSVEVLEAAIASMGLGHTASSRPGSLTGAPSEAAAHSGVGQGAAQPQQPSEEHQEASPAPEAPDAAITSTAPAPPDAGPSSSPAGPAASSPTPSAPFDWSTHPKHFFILSSSGKPIYSYHGDEHSLVGLSALISALVSVVQAQGDSVQHIRSGSTLIVFMLHGPLYFVAASSLGEPATALRKQLELLYGQLVLVVTTGLERIIQRNPSYDVRSLLDGVGGVLSSLVQRCLLAGDAAYLLGCYRPLPVPAADRAATTELLAEALRQTSTGLYALLMADAHVVATARARQQPALHPDDVLLLSNFVMCNNAYRHGHGEAFSPVCMPHFNSDAFLHAYIHYLDAACGMYLVLLAGSAEAFHQLSAGRVWFEEQAGATGLLQRLKGLPTTSSAAAAAAAGGGGGSTGGSVRTSSSGVAGRQEPSAQQLNVLCVENLPRPLGGRFGHTALWSYAVRYLQHQQVAFSPPCPLHRDAAGTARLAASYAQLHSLLHSPAQPMRPNRLAWFADPSMVLIGARDRDLELYLVCDPLTDKATGQALVDAMRKHFGDKAIAADVTFPMAPGQ